MENLEEKIQNMTNFKASFRLKEEDNFVQILPIYKAKIYSTGQ
jgi:hypothetical protein